METNGYLDTLKHGLQTVNSDVKLVLLGLQPILFFIIAQLVNFRKSKQPQLSSYSFLRPTNSPNPIEKAKK